MTKSGAVDVLERINRLLRDLENYEGLDEDRRLRLVRDARSKRRDIDDVIGFIKRQDREVKASRA